MIRLLESELRVVVHGDSIYMPLLMDPAISQEMDPAEKEPGIPGGMPETRTLAVIRVDGDQYIRSLSLESLPDSLGILRPDDADRIREELSASLRGKMAFHGAPGSKLTTVVLEIMPHFVRRRSREGSRRLSGKDMLEGIQKHFNIPDTMTEKSGDGPLWEELDKVRKDISGRMELLHPPKDKPFPARNLKAWVLEAMRRRAVDDELSRIKSFRAEMGEHPWMNGGHRAALLFVSQRGFLEMDGVGFFRKGSGDEFVIYRRTGEYALQDFYGRVYRFPECRVAVCTWGPSRPFVLDRYRHPFLESDGPGQPICLQDSSRWNGEFSAAAVIHGIEQGINALFHGYDRRRRNGYHSLDPMTPHERSIRFDDLRIAKDHADIRSGRLEIKNLFR